MAEESNRPGGTRKKFATPPVKIACLSCRASRTRCDGTKPCANCQARGRECVYRPSRRGGARVRKKPRSPEEARQDGPAQPPPAEPDPTQRSTEAIPLENFIGPGAGLSQLPDWLQDSDFIFDSLFTSPEIPGLSNGDLSLGSGPSLFENPVPMVRAYADDRSLLEAYYIFIHPYLPILPPPEATPVDKVTPRLQDQVESFEGGFEPASPAGLAIAAMLALVPCPDDPHYLSRESVLFRRKYAHYLAQAALETIEADAEIPDSSVEPTKALVEGGGGDGGGPVRAPFHPRVPMELESIIALDVLSIYEYAQRGNLKKMQSRSGQALISAMGLSIHMHSGDDEYAEARRRVWWMTYLCATQAYVVGNSKPSFSVFAPSFTAEYPTLPSDPEAFTILIRSQQAILASTQFVIDLKTAMATHSDMTPIYDRMTELDRNLDPLIAASDAWILPGSTTTPVDFSEVAVSRALRGIARIKLNSARIKVHRYCAFFDLPVFTQKHCDLGAKEPADNGGGGDSLDVGSWPFCSTATLMARPDAAVATSYPASGGSGSSHFAPSTSSPGGSSSAHSSPSTTSDLSTLWTMMPSTGSTFPFTSHYSSKVCLRSALNIAQAFEDLPYPNPLGTPAPAPPCYLSPTSLIVAPRTMASFACCAMQCAYVLLMVQQRARSLPLATNGGSGSSDGAGASPALVASLLRLLHQGLTSIAGTVENYSIALEALGGMRDQIRMAVEPSTQFGIMAEVN